MSRWCLGFNDGTARNEIDLPLLRLFVSSKQNNSDQSWLSLEQCNIQCILMKLVLLHILVNLRHLKISILFFKLSSLDLTIYQTNDKMILEITYKFLFWMIINKYLKFEINIMATTIKPFKQNVNIGFKNIKSKFLYMVLLYEDIWF